MANSGSKAASSAKPASRLGAAFRGVETLFNTRGYLQAIRQIDQVEYMQMLANAELGLTGYRNPVYTHRVREFNQAAIDLAKGKWYVARAMDTNEKKDWDQAFQALQRSGALTQRIVDALRSNVLAPLPYDETPLTKNGTEICFAGEVPIVPEICPIVVLKGSDVEMGDQYARQVIQIFGPWVLRAKSGNQFDATETANLREWERQLQQYAPEILDFCRGWAAGASHSGVPMSYEDVLDLWTGHLPPATSYFGLGDEDPFARVKPICSGMAAWGMATSDGKLIAGASGDYDCTFMATIVAFPDNGNNFIYTPFSVTGDVPDTGPAWFGGQPGMNDKGLAYVEHGGEMRMIEPQTAWGYGIHRGAAVIHALRFADHAIDAREYELELPVGDVGRWMGSAGGFFADRTYGYVLESRNNPVIVREAGVMGELDFLYASNNPMHPNAGKAGWIQSERDVWKYDAHGGWYPERHKPASLTSLLQGQSGEERAQEALRALCHTSLGRNTYMFEMLNRANGQIDMEYLKMLYRQTGSLASGAWVDARVSYQDTGRWESDSIGHAANCYVAVLSPDGNEGGRYAFCAGPAARGPLANVTNGSAPIYGETNAFWEIRLTDGPAGMVEQARRQAEENMQRARKELNNQTNPSYLLEPMNELLDHATDELRNGLHHENSALSTRGNDAVYSWAKAVRAYTRAQVRSLQALQVLAPPPTRPEDFGI